MKEVVLVFLVEYGKGVIIKKVGSSISYEELKVESNFVEVGVKIEVFIVNYIIEFFYIYSFFFVLIVVKFRSGDCIEYVVFFVVLVWVFVIFVRVVIGMIIVEDDSSVEVIGYVWNEFWFDGYWWWIDVVMYGVEFFKKYYLFLYILNNEGFGYVLGLLKVVLNVLESIIVVFEKDR